LFRKISVNIDIDTVLTKKFNKIKIHIIFIVNQQIYFEFQLIYNSFVVTNKYMKKVRLLQIVVYIAFGLFFLQNSAANFYEGFKEGYTDGHNYTTGRSTTTTLIPDVAIDGKLLGNYKDEKLQLDKNYSLEHVNVSANIRVTDTSAVAPFWLSALSVIIVFSMLILLIRIAYIMNKIILNIYKGEVFEKKSVDLIRQTGFLLIIYFVADYIFQQVEFYNEKALLASPVTIINNSAFNFALLISGLLVLIVAEAFKQGASLKEEQELTI